MTYNSIFHANKTNPQFSKLRLSRHDIGTQAMHRFGARCLILVPDRYASIAAISCIMGSVCTRPEAASPSMDSNRTDTMQITAVGRKRQLDAFIPAPAASDPDDPNGVAPLRFEQKQQLAEKNPFFPHTRRITGTAPHRRRIIGRISDRVDDLYQEQHDTRTGYFGMPEADNDPELFRSLLATAKNWLRDQGIRTIRGPFHLTINEACGLLVEGFKPPPCFLMGHARPWYGEPVQATGYPGARVIDALASTA
ncbi:MAG: hypothetical protein JSU62_09640 [Gammaproteobacteria bacterium]|nr:MAG: hypothetical protein JSU62_09640 [Gammaproteobacteria bacterium]